MYFYLFGWLVESVGSYHLISIKLALDWSAHLSNSGVHNRDGNLGLAETDQDQAASGFSGKNPEPFIYFEVIYWLYV